MRRKTLTPGIIKNYRFAAYPLAAPPEDFWEQARAMNALWNELVETREQLTVELNILRESDRPAASAAEAAATDSAARPKRIKSANEKTFWLEFDRRLVELSKRSDWKQRLGDNARQYILENFRTASVRAFRDRGTLRRKSAVLRSVVIPYRFTEGGWKTERIFTGNAQKLHLHPLPPEVYEKNDWQSRRSRLTDGFYGYGVKNRPLPLRVLMHRPLPTGGLVKTVKLTGKFDSLSRLWKWHLLITVQTAPAPEKTESAVKTAERCAALDIGYRRMADYLRIGYLLDTGGNQYELRLPIIEPPSRKLLNALKSVNRGREHNKLLPLTVEGFFPVTIFDVCQWQKINDSHLEQVKTRIGELLKNAVQNDGDFPEEVTAILKKLSLVRRAGLSKLRRITEVEAGANEALRTVHALLDDWQRGDTERLIKIKTTGTRLINKRNKIYENLALWLKKNFKRLVVGANVSLRQIAEAGPKISLDSNLAAIKVGAKYRFFAAHYFLRRKIREKNSSGWLIEDETLSTTADCYRCGAVCEPTPKIKISCPNGHEADRDFQSCRNRLKALPADFKYDPPAAPIPVPEHLKKYIVLIEPANE